MRKVTAAPATIDEYLAMLDAPKRAALQKVRAAIHAAAPGAEECISYGVPAFRRDGRVLMHMGAAANHCALYPGARPVRVLADELAKYDTSKGTVRFAPERPLPAALVRRLVKARIAEYAAAAAARSRRTP
jgi:uncharacterized protein YdhG (YjbR/CyaY superfamily)